MPQSFRRLQAVPILLLSASALAYSAPALAASTGEPGKTAAAGTTAGDGADSPADTELVVTGKRDQATAEVQKTPVSITSLSGDKLSQQGISTVRELGNIVPNLYQQRTAVSYLNATFFIRGIGELDAQGEPSVPVYVDGIYIPKTLGSQSELLDIDRLEVLRGPQGQSFGHSAEGGAILIGTIVPGDKPVIKAQAGYGNYNDARFGLALSGPLGDGFYGGVAASYHRRDGFNRNATVGKDTNNVDYLAGRGKLRYAPNDTFDVMLTVSGVRDRSTARGVQDLLRGDLDAHNQVYPFNRYDQLSASLAASVKLSDRLTLKSLTTAYGFNQHVFFDNTGDFYGRGSQLVVYRDRAYQQELKLVGNYDIAEVTAGIYYYRESWFTNRRANTAANATVIPANILYRPVYTLIRQNTDNAAGYGQAAIHMTPAATLTLGVRYNWERHTQNNQLYNLVAAAPYQSNIGNFLQVINADPQALVWSAIGAKSWGTWAPRAALDYRFNPQVLGYLTFSEGTKSAGYDYRAQAASIAGQRQASTPFDPERAYNFEGGFKTEWLNGRLRANLSAFYIKLKNIQITATDPSPPDGGGAISRRFNAGDGSSRGVEFEGSAVPVDGLQFDFNASYLDARLDRFTGTVTTTTFAANPANALFPNGFTLNGSPFAGAVLPNSPKWQGRIAATWQLPIKTSGAWTLNGDVNYQSSNFNAITNNFFELVPAQTYLDAKLTYTTQDQHWSLSLAARNLANKHYAQGYGYTPDTTAGPNRGLPIYRTTNYNDPRTVLFTIAYQN